MRTNVAINAAADRIVGRVAMARNAPAGGTGIVGFDPATLTLLITMLLPAIMRCFQPDDPQQLSKYVSKRYNPKTDTFDKRLLKNVTRQAKTKAWEASGRNMVWEDAEEVAKATLHEAMESHPNITQAIMGESMTVTA